ncbi:MAG: hypothetical protein KDA61_10195 [Planctomycetales bacterium]|nr:hypothetical protein [Planctomycetales bacterium]
MLGATSPQHCRSGGSDAMHGRFSRRTVLAAIDVLNMVMVQSATSAFLIELGPEVYRAVPDDPVSVAKRMNGLKRFVDDHPGYETDEGPIEEAIVRKAVGFLSGAEPTSPGWDSYERDDLPPEPRRFAQYLERDGFVIGDGTLRRILPAELGLPAASSELDGLLDKHGFVTAKGHLEQASEAHARGDWAAANGQFRTFIESMLDEMVERLDPTATALSSGHQRRAKLASIGLLARDLNEWDDHGKGFVNGLIRRLHPEGSHPGLSDEDDSTFRLHVVLLTARLLMRRFDRWSAE